MKQVKKILKQTKKTETLAGEPTVKKEKVNLDFSCGEIMKKLKSLTYIIDNHNALENLMQRLTEARDEFLHHAPTHHGLVVENSKEKVKLEKSRKKKKGESSNAENKKIWQSWCCQ